MLYVIPIESILRKSPVVPVSDTGTIPHRLRTHFPGEGLGVQVVALMISSNWNVKDVTTKYWSNPARFRDLIREIKQRAIWDEFEQCTWWLGPQLWAVFGTSRIWMQNIQVLLPSSEI
jgi:hypothetical protein